MEDLVDFITQKLDDIFIVEVNFTRATLKEANELKTILFNAIDNGERKIIVDLSQCEFIDSTFMGTLVISLRKVNACQGDLKLIELHPSARSLFDLAKMFRIFESYTSIAEARKKYKLENHPQVFNKVSQL
jgi:anti-anti-sigma factor